MTRKNHIYKSTALVILMVLGGVFMFPMKAYSTFISPPRVVIDANEAAGEMIILNRGDEAKIYTFKWQDRAMRKDGTIADDEEIASIEKYKPASEFLVYSPRQAILGPGETQRIRFFVKRDKMAEGEYRSHIIISAKPVKEDRVEVTEGLGGTINIIPQAGIPVMVRQGKTTVEIEPQEFMLIKEGGGDYLHAKFINKSTRTIYAKPTLFCQRAGAEKPEEIEAMSIRMYYEAENFDQKLTIRSSEPNFEGCQSIRLELTDKLDFQYSREPFYSQVLK